jgi:hypothetical protein
VCTWVDIHKVKQWVLLLNDVPHFTYVVLRMKFEDGTFLFDCTVLLAKFVIKEMFSVYLQFALYSVYAVLLFWVKFWELLIHGGPQLIMPIS